MLAPGQAFGLAAVYAIRSHAPPMSSQNPCKVRTNRFDPCDERKFGRSLSTFEGAPSVQVRPPSLVLSMGPPGGNMTHATSGDKKAAKSTAPMPPSCPLE